MGEPRSGRASALVFAGAFLLAAHPARTELRPRIANGVLAWEPASVGAMLCRVWESNPSATDCSNHTHAAGTGPLIAGCSGTLVGCRTFVTAAHCVCNLPNYEFCENVVPRDPSRLAVLFQHAGVFQVESVAVHPGYSKLRSGVFAFDDDVAVLRLADPVPGVAPSAVNDVRTPELGTSGTIVGFGLTVDGGNDAGIKRLGRVVTSACAPYRPDDGHLCWRFEEPLGPAGEDSSTCYGDSGGPLFADLGAGPALAGTTSALIQSPESGIDCRPPAHILDVDVFSVADFIAEAAGDDLGTTCPDVAADDPRAEVRAGLSGALGPTKPASSHAVEVPPGARLLRITLNAAQGLDASGVGRDFDLYAKAGAPPSPSDFDCAIAGRGQFGACEVASPAPGPWHVLVTYVAGEEGAYQATVVVPGAVCANGLDDDGDGFADADDPGCEDAADADEHAPGMPCDDGADNDGDGGADLRVWGGGGDPGCTSPWGVEDPACQDGLDNDGDGWIDFDGGAFLDLDGDGAVDAEFNPATPPVGPADPACAWPSRRSEGGGGCGLGFEIALLAPLLRRLTRDRS